MQANQLRPGNTIVYDGNLHLVMEASHRSPGNKRAFIQVTMRNLKNEKIIQQKFSSTEDVEVATLDGRKVQFSYADDAGYHFMDRADYETLTIGRDIVGDKKNYLKENVEMKIFYCENKAVELELPPKVELVVTESPDWVKGDSVSNSLKPVIVETGMKIMVPIFIKQNEKIIVDTRTGNYISRA